MRKTVLFLALLILPLAGYAKYCPSCLNTFQVRTVRGQTRVLYRWMMNIMSSRNELKKQDIKLLFTRNATITINGHRVAAGQTAIYSYLAKQRQRQPVIASKMRTLLVDQQYSTIAYQTVTKRKGHRYRSIVIAILEFKKHQLLRWRSVSHTRRMN